MTKGLSIWLAPSIPCSQDLAALWPQVLGHLCYHQRQTNLIDEAGLANIRVPTQNQGPRVWVNSRQSGQMLTHCEKFKLNVLNFT